MLCVRYVFFSQVAIVILNLDFHEHRYSLTIVRPDDGNSLINYQCGPSINLHFQGLPACDHQYNYAAQSYNEPCDSAYQLQPIYRSYSNDSDTSTRLNNHYIPNEQNSVTYNVFTPKPNACNYNPCLTPVSPAITNSGYIQNNAIDAKCEPPSNKRVVHYFEHLICSHVSIFL